MNQNMCKKYKYDFIIFIIISAVCVTVFGHNDVLVTAQRSLSYLKFEHTDGFFKSLTEFYSNAKSFLGDSGANYLPSTFIVFAIWNIPCAILFNGFIPELPGNYSLFFVIWNKMLPVVFFYLACILLYMICKRDFELDDNMSVIAALAFATSGIGFFSQFFFCQYDIFTVFCMLLGVHFYFKGFGSGDSGKNYWMFIFSFAIAASFKYYAILILVIMIIINEKNVIKIIFQSIMGCSVALLEGLFYLFADKDNFKEQVLEFPVLTYAQMSDISTGFATIKLFPLICCVILLVLYRVQIKDKESCIRWFIWGGCLVSIALFGFMAWHPQWLLFAIPFWTLAMVYNQDRDTLLYIDIIMSITFVGYVVNVWENNCDQNLLRYGVFMDIFRYRRSLPAGKTMARFFPISPDILYTVLIACMIGYCIWSYPRDEYWEGNLNVRKSLWLLRVRFLAGVMIFLIPAVLCVPNLLKQDELAWSGWETTPECRYASNFLMHNENTVIQRLTGIGGRVKELDIYTVVPGCNTEGLVLSVEICDEETMEVVAKAEVKESIISCNYTKIYFEKGDALEKGKNYLIVFHTNIDAIVQLACVEYQEGNVIISQNAKKRDHRQERVFVNDKWIDQATLQMRIYTESIYN